jgi:hypothetical protein
VESVESQQFLIRLLNHLFCHPERSAAKSKDLWFRVNAFEVYQEIKRITCQECFQAQSKEGFVTGHDFSRAAKAPLSDPALAAAKLQQDENIHRRG